MVNIYISKIYNSKMNITILSVIFLVCAKTAFTLQCNCGECILFVIIFQFFFWFHKKYHCVINEMVTYKNKIACIISAFLTYNVTESTQIDTRNFERIDLNLFLHICAMPKTPSKEFTTEKKTVNSNVRAWLLKFTNLQITWMVPMEIFQWSIRKNSRKFANIKIKRIEFIV